MTEDPRIFIPLSGVRVLDLAGEQGSYCARLLADLGADVLKVEPPEGDPSRRIGPFFSQASSPENSFFFQYHNTNKRGVTLDLERTDDRERFYRLAGAADVIVESFSPRWLEDRGLGFEVLRRDNPGLIMVSVTGFGRTGPRRNYRCCDLTAAAYGGQMYVTGAPGGRPLPAFGEQTSYLASLYAAVGVLLALRERENLGCGRRLDISVQEAVASSLDYVLVRYFHEGVVSARQGSMHWNRAFDVFPCRDGHILLSLLSHEETLLQWMEQEGWVADPGADVRLDSESLGRRLETISRWTRTHTVAELLETAQLMRMPWAPIAGPREVINSPQLKARGFFEEIRPTGGGGAPACPGLPFKPVGASRPPRRPAPGLGQDNASLSRGEGWLSRPEFTGLADRKVERAETGSSRGPLAGIRVLDFTWVLAGPYAARVLGDFGAEVIKVQTRRLAQGTEDNSGGHFLHWNRNKRSITLNLGRAKARELALRLAACSDVVIENFSPRVMTNWGLSYESIKAVRPDIIMVSLSAMGRTGSWRDYVGFGPTIQAFAGLTALTSPAEGPPLGIGYSHADAVAGLFAALAVPAALRHRERTGRGVHIDLSEYEAMCVLLGPALLNAACGGEEPLPVGAGHPHIPAAPYGCYPCRGRDRWCVIAVFSEAEWGVLCETAARPDWLTDPRFASLEDRLRRRQDLDEAVASWTRREDAGSLADRLQRAGLAAGVVQNAADIAGDPHLAARGFFTSLNHPTRGWVAADASPINFGAPRTAGWQAAPLPGEANRYVFLDLLGLTGDELAELEAGGVVA